MKCSKLFLLMASATGLAMLSSGCKTDLPAEPFDPSQRLTAGQVKMTVKIGATTQNEIYQSLGAPNMVALESGKGEIWTYDQIKVRRTMQGYNAGAFFGTIFPYDSDFYAGDKGGVWGYNGKWGIGSGGGGAGAKARAGVGTLTTSINTATLIIRFDNKEKVSSFKMLVTAF